MDPLSPILIGAAIGSAFTIVVQASGFIANSWRNRRYVSVALTLLERHLISSEKSLAEVSIDSPVYLRVARIRFCKTDRALLPDELQRVGLFSDANKRARGLMVMVRNSDIILEEIASRFDLMTEDQRLVAMEDAMKNVRILKKFIQEKGLGHPK